MNILETLKIGITTIVFTVGTLFGYGGGIANKNYVDQTPKHPLGSIYQVAGKTYFLFGGGIASTDSSITLTSFKLPVSSYNLTMSDFGTIGYLTIEPGNASRQEFVSFTGITQNSDGSATVTGVSRGLSFVTPYTASTTLQKSHSGGSAVVISNPPQLYAEFANKNNDETITGQWTFNTFPITAQNATSSETVSGVVELATRPEVVANTQSGGTTGRLVISTAVATTTWNTGTAAGAIPAAGAGGKIDSNFIDLSSFTGSVTITGSSNIASTTIYATTTSGTWVKPANLRYLIVEAVGGGGGGGGCTDSGRAGGGGGGGGYSKEVIPTAYLGATETVTIGAAGSAGTNPGPTAGGTGGTTSFGSHITVVGGTGGAVCATVPAAGGAGGTATGGDLNLPGGTGGKGDGLTTFAVGGTGGDSQLGRGAGTNVSESESAGGAGSNYGGGGSGAASGSASSDIDGGAGAPGFMVFTYIFY